MRFLLPWWSKLFIVNEKLDRVNKYPFCSYWFLWKLQNHLLFFQFVLITSFLLDLSHWTLIFPYVKRYFNPEGVNILTYQISCVNKHILKLHTKVPSYILATDNVVLRLLSWKLKATSMIELSTFWKNLNQKL